MSFCLWLCACSMCNTGNVGHSSLSRLNEPSYGHHLKSVLWLMMKRYYCNTAHFVPISKTVILPFHGSARSCHSHLTSVLPSQKNILLQPSVIAPPIHQLHLSISQTLCVIKQLDTTGVFANRNKNHT